MRLGLGLVVLAERLPPRDVLLAREGEAVARHVHQVKLLVRVRVRVRDRAFPPGKTPAAPSWVGVRYRSGQG